MTTTKLSTDEQQLLVALTLGLLELRELVALHKRATADEPADWAAVLADLDEIADAQRHNDPETRAKWIRMRDAFAWFALDATRDDADPHGFRAEARSAACRALRDVGLDPDA